MTDDDKTVALRCMSPFARIERSGHAGVCRLPHAEEPGEGDQGPARSRLAAYRDLPERDHKRCRFAPLRSGGWRHWMREKYSGDHACGEARGGGRRRLLFYRRRR